MLESLLQIGRKGQDPTCRILLPELTHVKAATPICCPACHGLGARPSGFGMTTDRAAILRAAQTMIERFGDAALAEIDLRIAELRVRDQHEAEELWREIREALIFLISKSDKDTKH